MATLVEAWRDIPARLVVVGDGEERARLAALAPPTVEFHDAVPADRVGEYLARARALVVPSIWYEGSPRTITEAYAAGVPVIASRCGALPGVVADGVTGALAEPGDAASWRAAVTRLLDDATSAQIGERAFAVWRSELQSGARDRRSGGRVRRGDRAWDGWEHAQRTWATGRNRRTARLTRMPQCQYLSRGRTERERQGSRAAR